MKAKIHPKWYPNTKVQCACGNKFETGATVPTIEVEVCSACHPFFTGQMKYVDTAGRVDAFKAKRAKAKEKILTKTQKRLLKKRRKIESELKKPQSLSELRRSPSKKKGKKTTGKKAN